MTRDDATSAPGGQYALINYFHAYIINPAKPNEQINLPAAKDLLNLLTSPVVPVTAEELPRPHQRPRWRSVQGGRVPDHHRARPSALSQGGTASDGHGHSDERRARLSGSLRQNGLGRRDRRWGSGARRQREDQRNRRLQHQLPADVERFLRGRDSSDRSDRGVDDHAACSATSSRPGRRRPSRWPSTARSRSSRVKSVGGKALVVGSVAPAKGHVKASVTVLARLAGSKGRFKRVATDRLRSTAGNFAVAAALARRPLAARGDVQGSEAGRRRVPEGEGDRRRQARHGRHPRIREGQARHVVDER